MPGLFVRGCRKALLAGCLALSWAAAASQGLGRAPPIVIGQSCDLSGGTSARVKEMVKGVDIYAEHVNRQGGVHGRQVRFIRYDDEFKPAKAAQNARTLIDQDGAFTLFAMGSQASTVAALPYAEEKGVPIFGSISGADSLRKPNPVLFHTRASFGEEIAKIGMHLKTVGMGRIAVIAANLPIGNEGLAAVEAVARREGLELAGKGMVAADLSDLKEAVAAIAATKAQAVLVLAPSGIGIRMIEALRDSGYAGQLVGLSVLSSDALYKALGEKAKGTIITQVVPFPWSSRLPLVREYQQLMAANKQALSIDSLEGYLTARLLVEALRAAGPNPTRKSFYAAVEGMTDKDLGGLKVQFSPRQRVAFNFVEITMLGQGGKLVN